MNRITRFMYAFHRLTGTLLWLLLLGGTAVSVTGVAMGVLYVRRKIRRKR